MKAYLALAAMLLLAACSSHQGGVTRGTASSGWNHWVCDSKAEVIWRYIEGSKSSVIDLRLGEDDVVHHLEQQLSGSGAFFSDGLIGFSVTGDKGLVYWVESNDLIGRDCRAR